MDNEKETKRKGDKEVEVKVVKQDKPLGSMLDILVSLKGKVCSLVVDGNELLEVKLEDLNAGLVKVSKGAMTVFVKLDKVSSVSFKK